MQFAVVHFFGDFNPPHARVGAKKRTREEKKREKKKLSHTDLAEKKCKEGRIRMLRHQTTFSTSPFLQHLKAKGNGKKNSRVCRGRKIISREKTSCLLRLKEIAFRVSSSLQIKKSLFSFFFIFRSGNGDMIGATFSP